jgi:hypothetical protein
MADEKILSLEMSWYYSKIANMAISALRKNNFDANYADNSEVALRQIIDMIPPKATIGCGDSVTLHQIGFVDWLREQHDHEVANPFFINKQDYKDYKEFREKIFIEMRRALISNVFLTSANAITLDGKIVNIDAHGNRAGGTIFGPNKVIVIVGANKIVTDVDQALRRIEEWAAPMNVKRHIEKHGYANTPGLPPCGYTGRCSHCNSDGKICRITTIIDGWSPLVHGPSERPPSIFIVGQTLGI